MDTICNKVVPFEFRVAINENLPLIVQKRAHKKRRTFAKGICCLVLINLHVPNSLFFIIAPLSIEWSNFEKPCNNCWHLSAPLKIKSTKHQSDWNFFAWHLNDKQLNIKLIYINLRNMKVLLGNSMTNMFWTIVRGR